MSPTSDEVRALQIYRESLDREGDERERHITERCAGNSDLEAAVRDLVRTAEATGVLDRSPSGWLHTPSVDSPGDRIGPYRVLETIGRGGMGVVYLAEQLDPIERKVALKLIQPGLQTQEVRARFEGERRALGLMNHPNIARVFEAGHTGDGRPYFAMEYVAGSSITDFANGQRLTIRERVELFLDVLKAIRHAHQKGIIHRDIKPGNVLVGTAERKPQVKVIDFGVAKAIDRRLTPDTVHTWSGRLVGTLEFMSPEQVGNERSDEDTRSDVYAAAMLLYELLVGALPFDRERFESSTLAEIHHLICEMETPKPSSRATQVLRRNADLADKRQAAATQIPRLLRGDLDAIVMKGLEKGITRRYQSVGEFHDDVVRYLEGRPIAARPPSRWYQCQKFVRRHRVGVAACSSIMIAVTIGLIVAWVGLNTAEHALEDLRVESAKTEAALVRVQAESEKWRSVLKFFEDMLSTASVDTVQGREAPVLLEALQFAADQASTQLASFPEGEASVRCTIAQVYLGLGRLQEARSQVALAESCYIRIEDPPAVLSAAVRLGRGKVESESGNLEPARLALEKSLTFADMIEEGHEMRSFYRTRSRSGLALVLIQTRELEEAEGLAREAIAIAERDSATLLREWISVNNTLAMILKSKREYVEAERIYRRSLEESRSLGDSPVTPQLESNLGMLLLYTERPEEAEKLLRSSLEARLRILDPGHERLAESYNNLAIAEQELGQTSAAIEHFLSARRILEASVEPTHPHVASLSFNIAELYEDSNDSERAIPEYQRALSIDERNYGANHLYVARDRYQLARATFRSGDAKTAESIARDAIESYEGAGDAEPWRIGRAMSLRAACLAALDRFDEAEPILLDAYARTEKSLTAEHVRTANLRRALHKLYTQWGKPEAAKKWE